MTTTLLLILAQAAPAAEAEPGQWLPAALEITAIGLASIIAVMAFFALLITLLGRLFPHREDDPA